MIRTMSEAEVFWQAVAASVAAATALSTGLAWAVGSWARNRSRAEADWAFTVFASFDDVKGTVHVNGTFANAGDANAFRLTMMTNSGTGVLTTPTGTIYGPRSHDWLAVIEPGGSVNFHCDASLDAWNDFVVTLDWITPPTRLKKHLQFDLRPAEFHPFPGVMTTDPVTGEVSYEYRDA